MEIQEGGGKNFNLERMFVRILSPVTAAEIQAVKKERKAKNILLMAIPKEHMRRFHGMDDAKEIWEAIRKREGLEKGYDRFQQLLSQLEAHGAEVSTEDANHKFLRSLPPAWSNLAMTMRTKPEVDTLSIDDLYNNLRVFEQEIQGFAQKIVKCSKCLLLFHIAKSSINKVKSSASFADEVIYSLFAKQLEDWDLLHEDLEQIANEIYEKDEKLKRYRRIGMKAVKEKEQLQKTLDSWKDSSKNLWRLINSGMSSNSKVGLGFEIQSNNELQGSIGTSSEHYVDPESEISSVPPEVYVSTPITTNEKEFNTGSFNVNNVRSKQPVPNKTSNNFFSPKRPQEHPLKNMVDRGIFDSGCSGHMTGNKDQLEDFEEFNGGSVTFGGSKGYISGKGKIRVGNLDFDSVSFVKELGHFNLFSISQICDKQHKVLFTETECLVVSSDFKMPDENQILLKVPRHHNMYSFDMKTPTPAKGFACLIAKATSDESKLWHRRLGHINFKNLNKLVKGNLVRGLPSKVFKNDHTCVACHKGKQHRASCKAKLERLITEPLHTLHMDLFGPTSVKSINHASYCLVITDDCTRFSWVFFLASKDETSGILQTFIRQIENQLSHRVKIIRSDNGTEFKNKDMLEFCGNKGIKQEYSNARAPQQNRVAKRMNKTLIEAARTVLADSLLPTTFWAEAVSI
ncbi:putative ribonuclease H-like domain-containing protein [Tanacetum coccineum]